MSAYTFVIWNAPIPKKCGAGRFSHAQSYFRSEDVRYITVAADGQLYLDNDASLYSGPIEFYVETEKHVCFDLTAEFDQGRLARIAKVEQHYPRPEWWQFWK